MQAGEGDAVDSSPRQPLGVERVGPQHDAVLAVLFEQAWGQQGSAESISAWRKREARDNPISDGDEPPKWVFLKDGVAIGYLGSIPAKMRVRADEFPAHWLKGLWVAPEFRAGPVGSMLLERALEDVGPAAASVVSLPARRLFHSLGVTDRGLFFNRLRIIDPVRLLSRLDLSKLDLENISGTAVRGLRLLQWTRTASIVGLALAIGFSLVRRVNGRPSPGVRLTRGWNSVAESDLDRIWESAKNTVSAASLRDGKRILWRYSGEPYEIVVVWREETPLAWAILRQPKESPDARLAGLSIASLSDLFFPVDQPELGLSLLAAVEELARDLSADAILCSGTHARLENLLARSAYVRVPGNLHMMARDHDQGQFKPPLHEWWLTRGDARSDDVF